MKIIYIFIFNSMIFCQIVDNSYYMQYSDLDSLYNFHTNFSYFESDLSSQKIHFQYDFYNSIINYNQKFRDNNSIFLYSLADSLNSNIDYELAAFLENKKNEPINNYSVYYNDEFNGLSGDIQKSYIRYKNNYLALKIGRDYFLPGKYLSDRLLFSAAGYPYDQFIFTFIKNKLSISSFYLSLNSFKENDITYMRHLSGRRVNLNFNNGYLALNEISIYGGENQQINFSLLNPFNISYIYQLNNSFKLNSILSLEYLFDNNNFSFFIEFVLDDFQIEKEIPSDLEPTEFAFLVNFNKVINKSINYNFNFISIANRTFNAPVYEYEKMIYKNFPIGHLLGNNFWKIENSIIMKSENYSLLARNVYIEKGEEALFSEFNKDYLEFDVDEGYSENFPFGKKEIMSGIQLEIQYLNFKNINLNTTLSYWFDSFLDNEGLNLAISIDYNYSF